MSVFSTVALFMALFWLIPCMWMVVLELIKTRREFFTVYTVGASILIATVYAIGKAKGTI